MAEVWNNPSVEDVRAVLEGWRGPDGWKMTNVSVELIDDGAEEDSPQAFHFAEHGKHIYAETDFENDNGFAGKFRVRYRADGAAYLEHVYLTPENVRTGAMTRLLADFQKHYRDWGLVEILDPTPAPAGVAFAQSQGFEPVDGDINLHRRAVDPE